MANPSVPGMDYWLLRDVLHAAGGASREMEIAAEVSRIGPDLLFSSLTPGPFFSASALPLSPARPLFRITQ